MVCVRSGRAYCSACKSETKRKYNTYPIAGRGEARQVGRNTGARSSFGNKIIFSMFHVSVLLATYW